MAFQPGAYQPDAFQVPVGVSGNIAQSLGGFTQALTGTSAATPPPQTDIEHVELVLFMVFGPIHQTMPSFAQSLEANVNDDALVLLLI